MQDAFLTDSAESEPVRSPATGTEETEARTRKSEIRREDDLATAEACHAAWLELDRRRLPRDQRLQIQTKILEKWAPLDL